MKVRVNLLMDKEVVQKAKDLGINLSKACENCLRNLNEAMIKAYSTKEGKSFLGEASLQKKVQCGRRDLNPGPQRGRLMS